MTTEKSKNPKGQVNVKLGVENHSRLEALAFIKSTSMQDLCVGIIVKELDKNAEVINKALALKDK